MVQDAEGNIRRRTISVRKLTHPMLLQMVLQNVLDI